MSYVTGMLSRVFFCISARRSEFERFHLTKLSFSEIRSSYYQLAKIHHPDHGGCQNIFLKIHSAYKNLRANVGDTDAVDVEVCFSSVIFTDP